MPPSIFLRGHHILCIQYYKGLGYSPAFVDNMSALVGNLNANPQLTIYLGTSPDDICRNCPNLVDGACHDDGTRAEQSRTEQDQLVLKTLGLTLGDQLSWAEIMEKLALNRGLLPSNTCGPCRWLKAGHCGEATGKHE